MTRRLTSSAILGVLMSLTIPSLAQVTTGTIVGSVQDSEQAVIPQAKVTVTNVDKGTSLVYQTDQNGDYRVPFLIPGSYRVTVEKDGFRSETRKGITLQVDQQARVDFMLPSEA